MRNEHTALIRSVAESLFVNPDVVKDKNAK